jgi:hypothetical protein
MIRGLEPNEPGYRQASNERSLVGAVLLAVSSAAAAGVEIKDGGVVVGSLSRRCS